ncbi:MAG TPA: metal-dependent hydrolase [Candidatus Angelobacter sp.]|nr:metal-dependent hydrolase [Candidatus Angelobacter sp.]
MEPITHFLTGACISRAGLNRKTGLATLTLVLAAEGPDIDAVSYLGGSVNGLQHHRGITHSFVGAPFIAAITIGVVYGIYRLILKSGKQTKLPPNWKLLYGYALLGSLSHILLDFTNNYGVRPFEPFNFKWYSWDVNFIVEPVVWAALILGLVLPGLFSLISEEVGARKAPFRGRGGAIFALLSFAVVLFVRDFEHRKAVNALNAITYHNENPIRASAFPTSINPFVWNGVVETQDFFETTVVDSNAGEIDPQHNSMVRYKPEETPVTLAAKKSRLGQVFFDWAQYPIVEVEHLPGDKGYIVRFIDLRFNDLRFNNLRSSSNARGRRRSILSGTVVLDSKLNVIDMYMGEK